MPHLLPCFRFSFALVALSSVFAAEPEGVLPPQSPLHRGALPNGLRYIIVPHDSPSGDLALRLVVEAGSLDELDDERGYAHFVEHMAFNGTRNLPPRTLRHFFQQLGLPAGSHLNARTSYTWTDYHLNLTQERLDRLDDCLVVLRDYADGLLFLPEEVTREKGVILSEMRTRDTADARIGHELLGATYAGTRLPERSPIGTVEDIENATPERLRAFYTRNYTPNRMTVVVVGAVDPVAMTAKITEAFGSMTTPAGATTPTLILQPPMFEGVRASVLPIPTVTSTQTLLSHIGEQPPDTVDGRREEQLRRLAITALDLRLRQRRDAGSLRVGPPRATMDPVPFGSIVQNRIMVAASAEDWDIAVQLVETELRRALDLGFTQAEIDEVVARRLAELRTAETDEANRTASQLAPCSLRRCRPDAPGSPRR